MSGDAVSLAYDYPVLGAFWTIMWIFLWVMWIFLIFRVIVDLFRDDDLSGWAKTGWLIFVLVLPFLGVFVYLIARGRGMGKREQEHARAQMESTNRYIRETVGAAGPVSEAEQLAHLSEVRARGDLTDEEFRRAKEKILHA
ncbi:SHOCT domain-containing protein [Streptomyces chumphonensis]|uniref:SHOCT domain-containing protein n=1 Tax=Streptomyces chumphonensis TaxID=1214925 RepID=UPI003D7278A3